MLLCHRTLPAVFKNPYARDPRQLHIPMQLPHHKFTSDEIVRERLAQVTEQVPCFIVQFFVLETEPLNPNPRVCSMSVALASPRKAEQGAHEMILHYGQ